MRYLLDTNALIEVINRPDGKVRRRVLQHRGDDTVTSSIAMHELYWGASKSQRQSHNLAVVDALGFKVLAFDRDDARHAGRVRAKLQQAGTPIGPYDSLIAGQALRHGLVLVTANTREFKQVKELTCEDWSR